jgi:hypothetical protein
MTPTELQERGLRVKPPVFEECAAGLWSSGQILGGEYRIKLTGGKGFQISRGILAVPDNMTWHPTLASAKAAAEADHAARIAAQVEVMG